MSWDVVLLEEVESWFFDLGADEMVSVSGAIDLLEQEGPTLGRPIADKVAGSKFHNMKELRPAATRQANGSTGTTRTSRSLNGDTTTG